MAYQLKYYFQYYPLRATEPNILQLWQNTDEVLVAEEVKTMAQCFMVEMPELDHKFQVVRGRGCTINLLSDTDRKFFTGLYHVNPQEFRIEHYIGENTGLPDFFGYLNAEMVTEEYDKETNYSFSITGNDGFALMDRFSFLQSDGSMYTGLKSKFELLQIIFSKIALPYDQYRISLATTFTGYSGNTDSTILHESYINCANFYDEDNKPMTLREVVESILAPYGAHIFAEEGHIYIRDIHTLASNNSITYKQFGLSLGNYVGQIAIPNVKSIAYIGYLGTGQQIELSGGVNRQVVEYSPYPVTEILEQTLINTTEFVTVPTNYSTKDGYWYKTLIDNNYWEIDPIKAIALNPTTFEISYEENESDAQVYLRYPRYAGINGSVAYLKYPKYQCITGSHITQIDARDGVFRGRYRLKFFDGVKFIITGQILVKTKDKVYDESVSSKNINSINLSFRIKFGDRYLNNSGLWVTDESNVLLTTYAADRSIISDHFIDLGAAGAGFHINIGNFNEEITLNGDLEIEIWSEYQTTTSTDINLVTNSIDVKEIWLSGLQIKLVNYDGTEIPDKDISYIGLLNKLYANEGEVIKLRCGTDMYFSDRGKILKKINGVYSDILTWTRNSQTFKIEELLLNSLSSNYRAGFITLYNMKLKNSYSFQNILTDTFLGTKKLMVKSINIDYWNHVAECALVEILPDELTIIKDATIA